MSLEVWRAKILTSDYNHDLKSMPIYNLVSSFLDGSYPSPNPGVEFKPPRATVTQSYLDRLMYFAKMYVLGRRFGIEQLMSLSLHKTHRSLQVFPSYRTLLDLTPVVRFVMANTAPGDRMRVLLAHYFASINDSQSMYFNKMLEEMPEFALEILKKVMPLMDLRTVD
ncbi:hypothetical protein F5X99DRAFT_426581 [Biscogniauxia marginata]|nr:hypothetical protein F5X99DRAFT_426581 [Biscogniauxia marginata]